jgi:cytoskeletal protein RodZ
MRLHLDRDLQEDKTPMSVPFRVPPDLLTVRHKRGVSLRDIAASTKIGVNYLQAIEDGEFEKLPGGVFAISYLKQYAQAIDYDEEELLGYYRRAVGIEPREVATAAPKRHSWLGGWLARVLG